MAWSSLSVTMITALICVRYITLSRIIASKTEVQTHTRSEMYKWRCIIIITIIIIMIMIVVMGDRRKEYTLCDDLAGCL